MNTVYSAQWCSWCQRAKALLREHDIDFKEVDIGEDATLQAEVIKLTGQRTVPQIFINDEHIGGYADLVAHLAKQSALVEH